MSHQLRTLTKPAGAGPSGVTPTVNPELEYLMTTVHHGSRKALAEAMERIGYRTLILVEFRTGEVVELAGSDPVAWGCIRAGAIATHRPFVDVLGLLLDGGELRTRGYSWRLA